VSTTMDSGDGHPSAESSSPCFGLCFKQIDLNQYSDGCGHCHLHQCGVCDNRVPECLLLAHRGCCGANCAIRVGLLLKTSLGDCCICMQTQQQLWAQESCMHEFCLPCLGSWKQYDKNGEVNGCPICRQKNSWGAHRRAKTEQ